MRRTSFLAIALLGIGCSSESAAIAPASPVQDAVDAGDGATPANAPPDASAGGDGGPRVPEAGLVPSGCIDAVTAGDHVFSCDGLTYDVRLPKACDKGKCGVVLDVHGATMSGVMEDHNTNLRAIGEREGYVVIQPNASGAPPTAIWNPSVDYAKVWSFFELARGVFAIDPKRVHMTGFSQGGRMTFTFACAHADTIASAAPAAETGCTEAELRGIKRELPILYMHGHSDALISFTAAAIPQRDAIVAGWTMGSPAMVGSDATHSWSRYTNAKGSVFEFIEHDYAAPTVILKGHCYPGSSDPKTVGGQLFSFACTGPNAFVWGEEVMKFFKAHPLP
jgi:polyhydroxybutyrate depolymerase